MAIERRNDGSPDDEKQDPGAHGPRRPSGNQALAGLWVRHEGNRTSSVAPVRLEIVQDRDTGLFLTATPRLA